MLALPYYLDCGHLWKPSEAEYEFTTGYGKTPDGKTLCYDCCTQEDKKRMKELKPGEPFIGYLTIDRSIVGDYPRQLITNLCAMRAIRVSNWPGYTLATITRIRLTSSGFSRNRFYFRCVDSTGEQWYGNGSDFGVCCTIRKCKPSARQTLAKQYRERKQAARKRFDGSSRLFEACWRDLSSLERSNGMINGDAEIDSVLYQFASEKVNNPDSSFYIYGA